MKSKLIYTGIRVKDLDKSVEFYTRLLGMKETGRTKVDMTKGETVGLVSEDGGHLLELNYYGKGSDFDTKLTRFLNEVHKQGEPNHGLNPHPS